jgi:hypothetical protein
MVRVAEVPLVDDLQELVAARGNGPGRDEGRYRYAQAARHGPFRGIRPMISGQPIDGPKRGNRTT